MFDKFQPGERPPFRISLKEEDDPAPTMLVVGLGANPHVSVVFNPMTAGRASGRIGNATRVAAFFDVGLPALVGAGPGTEGDIRAAEDLIKLWAPAFAAIRDAVHAVAQKEEHEEEKAT